MRKVLLSSAILAVPFQIQAQAFNTTTPTAISDAVFNEPISIELPVPHLNQTRIGLRLPAGIDQAYFAPPPVLSWNDVQAGFVNACRGKTADHLADIAVRLHFYNTALFDVLSAGSGIAASNIHLVPNYGFSVFLTTVDGDVDVFSTDIRPKMLLTGEYPATGIDLPNTTTIVRRRTCGSIENIVKARDLRVSYHAVGKRSAVSSFSVDLAIGQKAQAFIDLVDDQSETEETRITTSTSGGGFSIAAGPVMIGNTASSGETLSDVKRYRAANRNWWSDRAGEIMTQLDITEICEGADGCVDETIRSSLLDMILSAAREETARLVKRADGDYDLLIGATNLGTQTFTPDETLNTKLNNLYDMASSDEAEVSYGDLKVKAKKTDDLVLDIGNSIEFTKYGEERWLGKFER